MKGKDDVRMRILGWLKLWLSKVAVCRLVEGRPLWVSISCTFIVQSQANEGKDARETEETPNLVRENVGALWSDGEGCGQLIESALDLDAMSRDDGEAEALA